MYPTASAFVSPWRESPCSQAVGRTLDAGETEGLGRAARFGVMALVAAALGTAIVSRLWFSPWADRLIWFLLAVAASGSVHLGLLALLDRQRCSLYAACFAAGARAPGSTLAVGWIIVQAVPQESPVRISAVLIGNRPGIDATACVRALRSGTVTPQEIVLVTAGSAVSDTAGLPEQPMVRHEKVRDGASWAKSCGLGLERTTGDLIAVVDAACEVDRDWLALLTAFLADHPDAAAVEGKRRWRGEDGPPSGASSSAGHIEVDGRTPGWSVGADSTEPTREVACLSATAFVVRRLALDGLAAPVLDSRFQTLLAAYDLFARLLESGRHLYYVAQAVAYCADSDTWARATAKAPAEPAELLLFASKHLSDAHRDEQVDKLSKVAYPGLRALLAPPTAAMLAARAALAWLREHKHELAAERGRSAARAGAFQAAVDAAQARGGYSFHPRQDVIDLISASAKVVIDVGCASGVLGAALKRERPGIQVRGVEISPEAAERARQVLDDVFCGGAEAALPSAWPRPDCVVFADVLEHLPDPWSLLRRYRELLGPGGKVVVSVPNIGHRTVVEGLLRGRFDYVDAGVLDRTHLRFFTRATAIALIEDAGFKVERIHCNLDAPTRPLWLRMANRLGVLSAFLQDYQTVQFVIVATVPQSR